MKRSIILILFSILIVSSCSLDRVVHRKNKKGYKHAPYDVMVVPGYPYDAPSNKELFATRLHWAKTLYDRGIAKNIIFSGDAVHTPYYEGKLMKLFAIQLGIPAEHVFSEDEALHTTENIKYSKKLADKLGFKKIVFATDPYQFSYMTSLVNFLAPGTPLLTFPTDSMAYYSTYQLPEVDIQSAFMENWKDKTIK